MMRFDVFILGAGVAGCSLAEASLRRGFKTGIFDPKSPGSGASGAPIVITNIATGRRARRVNRADECLHTLHRTLQWAQEHSEPPFFKQTDVLRPAFTDAIADDFRASLHKYEWKSTELEWIDRASFAKQYPWIGSHEGGLRIRGGFTIDAPLFLKAVINASKRMGLQTYFHQTIHNIEKRGAGDGSNSWGTMEEGQYYGNPERKNKFRQLLRPRHMSTNRAKSHTVIQFTDGSQVEARHVIYAAGAGMKSYPIWNFLPLSYLKGELLEMQLREPMPAEFAFSGIGYVASDPSDPRRVITGSTFEREYDSMNPTTDGHARLRKIFHRLLPGFSENVESETGWAGVRVSLPDYQPVVGEHPEWTGHWVFTGLGSKGMLMSPYLAMQLIDVIAANDD